MLPRVDLQQLVADLAGHVGRQDVLADVESVYASVAEAVSANAGDCQACGQCCQFGRFGHILYVTTPELVHVITRLKTPGGALEDSFTRCVTASREHLPGEMCPLQENRLCGIRTIRPLGCRLFFCGPGSRGSQAPRRNIGGGEKPGGGGTERERNTLYRSALFPGPAPIPSEPKTAGLAWIVPPPPGFSPRTDAVVPGQPAAIADPNDWIMPLFERMQQRMKRICQTRSMPYAYVEWTSVLKAVLEHDTQ